MPEATEPQVPSFEPPNETFGFHKKLGSDPDPEEVTEEVTEAAPAPEEAPTEPEKAEEGVEAQEAVEEPSEEPETPLGRVMQSLAESVKEAPVETDKDRRIRQLEDQMGLMHKLLNAEIAGEAGPVAPAEPEQIDFSDPAIVRAIADSAGVEEEEAKRLAPALGVLANEAVKRQIEPLRKGYDEKIESLETTSDVTQDRYAKAQQLRYAITKLQERGGVEAEIANQFSDPNTRKGSLLWSELEQNPAKMDDWREIVKSGLFLARAVELTDGSGGTAPVSPSGGGTSAATGKSPNRGARLNQPTDEKTPEDELKERIRHATSPARAILDSWSPDD